MKQKDLKDRVADAIETDNPPGSGYYGAEVDEAEVEADLQRMEHAGRADEQSDRDTGSVVSPSERREKQD